jgi:hypothetical protein
MGYGLWDNLIQRAEPHRGPARSAHKLVECQGANFEKPGNHVIGVQRLKPKPGAFKLWVNWIQPVDSTCGFSLYSPTSARCSGPTPPSTAPRRSGTSSNFEKSKGLKPVARVIGSRVETTRFQAQGQVCIQLVHRNCNWSTAC